MTYLALPPTGGVSTAGGSTHNAVARWDGTDGSKIQNSGVIVDDSNNVSGVAQLTMASAVIGTLAGFLKAAAGTVSAVAAIALGTDVSGVLPVANGGTNSSTALNSNRFMVSSGGKIVEASAVTASRALASDVNGLPTAATTTATELGYVNGVTSAIQTQLDAKQATVTGGATSIVSSNLTASRALASDASGKVAVVATTDTELGYVAGVTSAIQTQLTAKAAGAASSTDTAFARYSGTGGKTLQNSGVTCDGSNNVAGIARVEATTAHVGATGAVAAGACLDVDSTSGGLLLPRMTSTQRDALAASPNGLLIYNTTTATMQGRIAGAWLDLTGWGT